MNSTACKAALAVLLALSFAAPMASSARSHHREYYARSTHRTHGLFHHRSGSTWSGGTRCSDGSTSHSRHRSGTCSHHGGIGH